MVTPLLKTFDIYQDINLNVMVHNQTLTELSERLVNKIGKAIALIKPDWILVQGIQILSTYLYRFIFLK